MYVLDICDNKLFWESPVKIKSYDVGIPDQLPDCGINVTVPSKLDIVTPVDGKNICFWMTVVPQVLIPEKEIV